MLAVAGLAITVQLQATPAAAYVSPKLIPIDEVPLAEPIPDEPVPEDADRRAAWEARDAELIRRQRELDKQAEQLQAERAEWHDRRRAIEQELADCRKEETDRVRAELAGLRQQWLDECNHHREELVQRGEQLQAERDAFEPSRQALREEQARTAAQTQELARQRELFAADRDIFEKSRESFEAHRAAETDRLSTWGTESGGAGGGTGPPRRTGSARPAMSSSRNGRAFQDDLLRLERRTAAVEQVERESAARSREIDVRLEQLKRDAAEWEETVRQATAEQERLRTAAERLDRQKTELDAQSATLAERAAQIEAQQAVVAVFRAKLDRSRQDMEREAWQLAAARVREDESQTELRKRIQEAEELRAAIERGAGGCGTGTPAARRTRLAARGGA